MNTPTLSRKSEQDFEALAVRRLVLKASLASVASLPGLLSAQATWPERPIKLIDVFAPGGSTDVIARWVGNRLSSRLGQPVVIENKTGAGGVLGFDAVAKSRPDGYNLLIASTALPTIAASGKKLPFDALRDLMPVGLIGTMPLIIVVPTDSPIKSLRDLVELARLKPQEGIRYGSSGVGSMSHLGMELLASEAKVQMLHIPYKGVSLSVTDLMSGQLHALLGTVATHKALLDSGKLRALVIASPQRSALMPQIPTSAEAGYPGFEIEYWIGMMGPAGMPAGVVQRLNSELNAVLRQSDAQDMLGRFGGSPKPGMPEDFGRLTSFEVNRWTQLIKAANIQIE